MSNIQNSKPENQMQKVKQFEGTLLQKRFKVERMLGQGSFGNVHKVTDTAAGRDGQPMVAKASTNVEMLYNEIKALEQVSKYAQSHLDQVSLKTAKAIPVNLGRGIVYQQKQLNLNSRNSTKSSLDKSKSRSDDILGDSEDNKSDD